jgi:hypothetical protein
MEHCYSFEQLLPNRRGLRLNYYAGPGAANYLVSTPAVDRYGLHETAGSRTATG